jgi:methyltransferase (TIGR00027 family)
VEARKDWSACLVEKAKSSRTAVVVAIRRAVHQLCDSPVVFHDPLAATILGATYADRLQAAAVAADEPLSMSLRAFLAARSRYAEDNLRQAVVAGVRQYVLLGAGLDTFAYRNPYPNLRVFEVDHPATQFWKRELLPRSGIAIPASLAFVPIDFEAQSLSTQLAVSRFDASAPAYFAWLGVVPYLTIGAFRSTIAYLAARPAGTGVSFDYGPPREALSDAQRVARDALASRVESLGEPFQLFFTPAEIAAELCAFRNIEDLGSDELDARYFAGRTDRLALHGASGRLVTAWR